MRKLVKYGTAVKQYTSNTTYKETQLDLSFSTGMLFCFLLMCTTTIMTTDTMLMTVIAPIANTPPTVPSTTDCELEAICDTISVVAVVS